MFFETRGLGRQASLGQKFRVFYTKATFSRFTSLYLVFSFFCCLSLVILQGLTYSDNAQAANAISQILTVSGIAQGVPIVSGNTLYFCPRIPRSLNKDCEIVSRVNASTLKRRDSDNVYSSPIDTSRTRMKRAETLDVQVIKDPSGTVNGVNVNNGTKLDMQCLRSFVWLESVLRDSTREDLATLFFHLWLVSLTVLTLMNDSLPHLFAALAGHALVTLWAAFRVNITAHMMTRYRDLVVLGPCQGVDLLGNWWTQSTERTIPIVVVNAITCVALSYLSLQLYRTYTTQTFGRVGVSPEVNRVYKLVLVLSVMLQLAGFFTLASTALWIDKLIHPTIRTLAVHFKLYLAAFIVTAVLQGPWLVTGWTSVRRERHRMFSCFCVLSVLLLLISTVLFGSSLYRFIFAGWPFFATITVSAYILTIATCVFGVLCRLHFGRGLAHFLRVNEVLEDSDFTPVVFPNDTKDFEKAPRDDPDGKTAPFVVCLQSTSPIVEVQKPAKAHGTRRMQPRLSIYSEVGGNTFKLSATPSLMRGQSQRSQRPASPGRSTLSTRQRPTPELPIPSAAALGSGRKRYEDLFPSRAAVATPRVPPQSVPPTLRVFTDLSKASNRMLGGQPKSKISIVNLLD